MRRLSGRGFTLIELLVVLAILALLLTIAAPRYIDRVERARETALHTDLKVMREAIDKFEGDQGRLPASLEELVSRRYLKEIPVDPITEKRDTWISVAQAGIDASTGAGQDPKGQGAPARQTGGADAGNSEEALPGIADVRSGATGKSKDGTEYGAW